MVILRAVRRRNMRINATKKVIIGLDICEYHITDIYDWLTAYDFCVSELPKKVSLHASHFSVAVIMAFKYARHDNQPYVTFSA